MTDYFSLLPYELTRCIFECIKCDGIAHGKYKCIFVCRSWYRLLASSEEFQYLSKCNILYSTNAILSHLLIESNSLREKKLLEDSFKNFTFTREGYASKVRSITYEFLHDHKRLSVYTYSLSIALTIYYDKKYVCCDEGARIARHKITSIDDFEKFRYLAFGDSIVEFLTQLNEIPFIHKMLALQ